MRILHLSLISCILTLAGGSVLAQKPRCADANGVAYACGNTADHLSQQNYFQGSPPQKSQSIDLFKLGKAQWEPSTPEKSGSSYEAKPADPNLHRKPDPLDGWPKTLRTEP